MGNSLKNAESFPGDHSDISSISSATTTLTYSFLSTTLHRQFHCKTSQTCCTKVHRTNIVELKLVNWIGARRACLTYGLIKMSIPHVDFTDSHSPNHFPFIDFLFLIQEKKEKFLRLLARKGDEAKQKDGFKIIYIYLATKRRIQ